MLVMLQSLAILAILETPETLELFAILEMLEILEMPETLTTPKTLAMLESPSPGSSLRCADRFHTPLAVRETSPPAGP